MFDSSWFQSFDFPVQAFDSTIFTAMLASVKYSLRSVASIGLIILGVVLSAALISKFANEHFLDNIKLIRGVEKRVFSRKVFSEDYTRNPEAVIEDGVLHREISFLVGRRFSQRHRDSLVDDMVFKREMKHDADVKFRSAHKDWDVDDAVYRQEVSAEARARMGSGNKEAAKQYYRGRRRDG